MGRSHHHSRHRHRNHADFSDKSNKGSLSIARVGDISVGVCFCHDSPVVTIAVLIPNQSLVYSENRNIITLGSLGLTSCGHITVVTTSSSLSYVNGIGIARVSDGTIGCMIGNISTGSNISYSY